MEAAGLADDTIIFYFGDHGPGMPRCKRSPYNSGLHVPLIVTFPRSGGNWRPRTTHRRQDRSAGRIRRSRPDGAQPGRHPAAVLHAGPCLPRPVAASPNTYLHGFRDRMDERYDMVRSTRDKRYVYVRNYMPHRRYGEHVAYMFETPTTQVWQRLFTKESCHRPNPASGRQNRPKSCTILQTDPDEVNNLAESPEHRETLERLRGATHDFLIATRDVGFLPEPLMHEQAGDGTIFEMAQDPSRYPIEKIVAVAETATSAEPQRQEICSTRSNRRTRRFATGQYLGLLIRGEDAVAQASEQLGAQLVNNPSCVAIAAAEALARYGQEPNRTKAVDVLVELADVTRHGPFTSTMALNALDAIGPAARPVAQRIEALNTTDARFNQRMRSTDVANATDRSHPEQLSDSKSE